MTRRSCFLSRSPAARWILACVVVGWGGLGWFASAAHAQNDMTKKWLDRVGGLRPAAGQNERMQSAVVALFKPVVAEARLSTAAVLVNNKHAALGAVVDGDGFIVTKASEITKYHEGHEIMVAAGDLACELADGRRLEARLVGLHADSDLAMLKVDAVGLPALKWREGDSPAVGSWLATPALDDEPVSIGVVSVVPRRVPSPTVLGILLGEEIDLARIQSVMPGSGAEKAGLKPNDVIKSLNGQAVATRQALIEMVQRFRPGDKVRLDVSRGNQSLTVTATLGKHPGAEDPRKAFQNNLGGELSKHRAGYAAVLQHDSVLRPNECGGPIVDLEGKAVGLNIARAGRVESYALPVSMVLPLLGELKSGALSPFKDVEQKKSRLAEQLTERDAALSALNQKVAEAQASAAAIADEEAKIDELLRQARAKKQAAQDQLKRAQAELEKSRAERRKLEEELKQLDKLGGK